MFCEVFVGGKQEKLNLYVGCAIGMGVKEGRENKYTGS